LVNPDTELTPNCLELLVEALREHPGAGLVGPRLLNTDSSLQTSCVQSLPTPLNQALDSNFLINLFPKSRLWGSYDAYRALAPVAVEAVSGALMVMRTDFFREIGGFTADYFMYAEDMDLC